MAGAPRRPDFEDEGDTKPRNRRSYQKPAKEKPFGKDDKDHKEPRGRKRTVADDDPALDEDDFHHDLDPDDLDDVDLDDEDLDLEDLEEDDWDPLAEDDL